MKDPTRLIADAVRIGMARLARSLNTLTKGKLLPAHITILSFLGHIPAVWALWNCRPNAAAVGLVAVVLLHNLDSALAEVQKNRSGVFGMFRELLNASKELLVFVGLAAFTAQHDTDVRTWVLVAAAGTSLLHGYVGLTARTAAAQAKVTADLQLATGLVGYGFRMVLIIVGLLTENLAPVLHFMIALNMLAVALTFLTAAQSLSTAPKRKTQNHG